MQVLMVNVFNTFLSLINKTMFESRANLFRNGRYSSLTIDGTQTEEGTSVGMFSILNVKGPVYIGKIVTIIQ